MNKKLKFILFACLLFSTFVAKSQTGVYNNLDVNNNLRLRGKTINGTVNDSTLAGDSSKIPTVPAVKNALNSKANDNAVLHLAGVEAVPGVKTFTGGSIYINNGTTGVGSTGTLYLGDSYITKSYGSAWVFPGSISSTGRIAVGILDHIPGNFVTSTGNGANFSYRTASEVLSDIGAEPTITKNTAFNKNFGTTAGTVPDAGDVTTKFGTKADVTTVNNLTDSLRNNSQTVERRRVDGAWVPQFALPTGSGSSLDAINVKDAPYNAPMNGTSDDEPAILAAITAAKTGQTVIVPSGSCHLGTKLDLTGLNTKNIIIDWYANTTVAANTDGIEIGNNIGNPYVSGVTLNLYGIFTGTYNGGVNTSYTNIGVILNNCYGAHVFVNHIEGFNRAIRIQATGSTVTGSSYNEIRYLSLIYNYQAISLFSSDNVNNYITSNSFYGGTMNGVYGIRFEPMAGIAPDLFDHNNFYNCSAEGITGIAYYLDDAKACFFIDNARTVDNENPSATAIYYLTSSCWDNTISTFINNDKITDLGGRNNFNGVISNSTGSAYYNPYFNLPTNTYIIPSKIKITSGSPGSGKVLTSDASGNGTWQTPASSGSSGGGSVTVKDDMIAAMKALGSNIKYETVGLHENLANSAITLVSAQSRWMAVYVKDTITITGVNWIQRIAGSYTASNFNGAALYSVNAGTLTQVAITANTGSMWQATANTLGSIAFTSTYSALPGVYFVELIYNSSGQTTAPQIGGLVTGVTAQSNLDLTNNAKLFGFNNATTTPLSSQDFTTISTTNQQVWGALY